MMLPAARHLREFMLGLHGSTQTIAFVPGELVARINARSCNLMIERECARKLLHKHRLRYEHWGMIQIAIDHGYALLSRRSPGKPELLFAYVDDAIFNSNFLLAIKQANAGSEIWMKSFYRCEPSRIRSFLRSCELLREHA
jgi:hypothetical protein